MSRNDPLALGGLLNELADKFAAAEADEAHEQGRVDDAEARLQAAAHRRRELGEMLRIARGRPQPDSTEDDRPSQSSTSFEPATAPVPDESPGSVLAGATGPAVAPASGGTAARDSTAAEAVPAGAPIGEQIVALLVADPSRTWKAGELAPQITGPKGQPGPETVRKTANRYVERGLIRRLEGGHYQALPQGDAIG